MVLASVVVARRVHAHLVAVVFLVRVLDQLVTHNRPTAVDRHSVVDAVLQPASVHEVLIYLIRLVYQALSLVWGLQGRQHFLSTLVLSSCLLAVEVWFIVIRIEIFLLVWRAATSVQGVSWWRAMGFRRICFVLEIHWIMSLIVQESLSFEEVLPALES